jgi:hypothetical protein
LDRRNMKGTGKFQQEDMKRMKEMKEPEVGRTKF